MTFKVYGGPAALPLGDNSKATILNYLEERRPDHKEAHEIVKSQPLMLKADMTCRKASVDNCAFTLLHGFAVGSLRLSFPELKSEQESSVRKAFGVSEWDACALRTHGLGLYSEIAEEIWKSEEMLEHTDSLYAQIASSFDKFKASAGVLISDSIAKSNIGATSRMFKASNFMGWLVKNRYGVVFMLPPTINPNHSQKGNLSIVQSAWWIPPLSIPTSTSWRVGVINFDRLPDRQEWEERIGKLADAQMHMPLFNEEETAHAEKIQAA